MTEDKSYQYNDEFYDSLDQKEKALKVFLSKRREQVSLKKNIKKIIERIRGKAECEICHKRYKNIKCHEQMKHGHKRV